MSKTDDIEFDIRMFLRSGPKTLDEVMSRCAWVDDRRWVGVAIDLHLVPDGFARYGSCDVNHNHSGSCTLEAVA